MLQIDDSEEMSLQPMKNALDPSVEEAYLRILKQELVPAMGCTEPIAIAYAAATARAVLGDMPDAIQVLCSGNLIKNASGVTVPNSGGMKGIEAAAVLGTVGGQPELELEVLSKITEEHISTAKELLLKGICTCRLVYEAENLYIRVIAVSGENSAEVEISEQHNNITEVVKNHKILQCKKQSFGGGRTAYDCRDYDRLNLSDILRFANTVQLEKVEDLLNKEIEMNSNISQEGLQNGYGAEVGRTLVEFNGQNLWTRMAAAAAAGSDARMNGCALPVVINSGSGNQGLTVSLPLIEYASFFHIPKERLLRALLVSNLVAIHQKRFIGRLSAYCGAVNAACGCGAAIAFLEGGDEQQIGDVIVNTAASIGGMICDGAKSSCAAKIADALQAAFLAVSMAKKRRVFQPGEGLVGADVEQTIERIGRVGREGMRQTDVNVLNIMIGK